MSADKKGEEIILDIRGTLFKVRRSTLKTIPNSRLALLEVQHHKSPIFFDRDPESFNHILSAYRDGELHIPKHICPQRFQSELDFWKIPIDLLAPCCWKTFYKTQEDLSLTAALLARLQRPCFYGNAVDDRNKSIKHHIPKMLLKKKDKGVEEKPCQLWLFLEEPASSPAAKAWCFFYTAVVLINIAIILLWAEPSVRVDPYISNPFNMSYFQLHPLFKKILKQRYSEHVLIFLFSDVHPVLFITDLFCMAFFILETLVHFCACPNKKRYLLNIYNAVKVILCMTMVVTLSLRVNKHVLNTSRMGIFFLMMRCISVTRLLLIFRLRKLFKSLDILFLAVQRSFRELLLLGFVLIVYAVIYGTVMFSAEALTNNFPNVWLAIWWALVTMTTVGYGDFYPTTLMGYIFGSLCAISGVIVLALPVAAVASNFANLYSKQGDLEKHQKAVNDQASKKLNCWQNKGESCKTILSEVSEQ